MVILAFILLDCLSNKIIKQKLMVIGINLLKLLSIFSNLNLNILKIFYYIYIN